MQEGKSTPEPWRAEQVSGTRIEIHTTDWQHKGSSYIGEIENPSFIDSNDHANAALFANAKAMRRLLDWFVGQFEGESGAGVNHWQQSAEFNEAKLILMNTEESE